MTGNRGPRFLLRTALLLCVFLSVCEGAARLFSPFAPLVPFSTRAGYPALPSSAHLRVALDSGVPVDYATDSRGARVVQPSESAARPQLLVVGDSQALGYGLPFDGTAAALVSGCLSLPALAIAAAPATDVEDYMLRLGIEAATPPARVIVVLNLGNDLDEVYATGQWFRGVLEDSIAAWLIHRSRAYQLLAIRVQELELARASVPGVNRLLYDLASDERRVLVEATARRVIQGVKRFPHREVLVVVIPSDLDVSSTELEKYGQYSTMGDFGKWLANADAFSNQHGAMRRLLVARIAMADVDVVDLHPAFSTEDARTIYARTSHHLTAKGNALMASAICAHLDASR